MIRQNFGKAGAPEADPVDGAPRNTPEAHFQRSAGNRQYVHRGLVAAVLILSVWIASVGYAWFSFEWLAQPLWLSVLLLVFLVFMFTGVFITAHEAMHRLVAPAHPRLNDWIGRISIFCFAGFSFDAFLPAHHAHHDHTASSGDPDFHDGSRRDFVSWYLTFMKRHISIRPFALYTGLGMLAWFNQWPFLGFVLAWPLPALVSSLQLFYFGTYLPHREPDGGYNHLRSRSNDYPEWLSLLTCFHFGYHYEHHLMPGVPWWRLPAARRALGRGADRC